MERLVISNSISDEGIGRAYTTHHSLLCCDVHDMCEGFVMKINVIMSASTSCDELYGGDSLCVY